MAPLILKRLMWLVGIFVALGGAYLLYKGGQVNSASVYVIETSTSVSPGTMLTSSNLGSVKVAPAAVNPGAVQTPSQLLGKVVTVPLPSGQQILPQWLSVTNITLGSSFVDIPLPVSVATSAVGSLQSGERVSLLWLPNGLVNQAPVTEFLSHPLTVIAVRDAQGNVEGQSTGVSGVTTGAPAIVDLRVTPSQAVQIENQAQSGKLIVLGIAQKGALP